jgi:uncharacterized protein YjiS (DUF1127 family)
LLAFSRRKPVPTLLENALAGRDEPASLPITDAIRRATTAISAFLASAADWRALRKVELELMVMDDRMLMDIGVKRSDIRGALKDALRRERM